eukprot:g8006.t1
MRVGGPLDRLQMRAAMAVDDISVYASAGALAVYVGRYIAPGGTLGSALAVAIVNSCLVIFRGGCRPRQIVRVQHIH